jgi:hypothetical protein
VSVKLKYLTMLNQGEWWIGQQGAKVRIEEMERRHCRNVVKMLLRNRDEVVREIRIELLQVQYPPTGRQESEEVQAAASKERERMKCGPLLWLRSTPLMLALRQRGWPDEEDE